jgi:hypothetical protein
MSPAPKAFANGRLWLLLIVTFSFCTSARQHHLFAVVCRTRERVLSKAPRFFPPLLRTGPGLPDVQKMKPIFVSRPLLDLNCVVKLVPCICQPWSRI